MAHAESGGQPQRRQAKEITGGERVQPFVGTVLPGEKGRVHAITPAAKESATPVNQEGFNGQLDIFLSRAKLFDGTWVRSMDMGLDAYIRLQSRPYGRPTGYAGIIGDDISLPTTACLEIADVVFKSDAGVKKPYDGVADTSSHVSSWESFIDGAVSLAQKHGLGLVYVENVTEPGLLSWFVDQIGQADPDDPAAWQRPEIYKHVSVDENGRYSFFKWI